MAVGSIGESTQAMCRCPTQNPVDNMRKFSIPSTVVRSFNASIRPAAARVRDMLVAGLLV